MNSDDADPVPQTEADRWGHIADLDEELLKGGVVLSEWCAFIVRDCDKAFVGGAHLASIVVAVSGIETHLRSEYGTGKDRFAVLIDQSPIDPDLKRDLHRLRLYRNRWVHVGDPWNDQAVIDRPDELENELTQMAYFAVRTLRRTLYENPWI